MPRKKYKIEYLPAADRDLAEIINYISVDLAAPQAATGLLEKIKQAVESLVKFPFAHAIYQPISNNARKMPFEFRSLIVSSYLIFYYITENIVTIARVIYSRRDMQSVSFDDLRSPLV